MSATPPGALRTGGGILGRFLGNTIGEGAAFAAGVAIGPVLEPPLRLLRNNTNSAHPFVYPDAGSLAEGVAHGKIPAAEARHWASFSGIGPDAFSALVAIAEQGPGTGEAFTLWRRGKIDTAGFRRALDRAGLAAEWVDALVKLRYLLLDPAVVANAVQQGHLPNHGILADPVTGGPPFDIPLTQIDLDPVELADAQGIDLDSLRVMANLSGLPPPQAELLEMWNRGIITEAAVEAGIREGHTKTKWIPAVKAMRRRYLSPVDYVAARLRAWITDAEMHAGAALHGLEPADADLLLKIHGRPLSWHQVFIGIRRGGVYDGPVDAVDPAFLKAIEESDIRPEWTNIAWAQRFSYPAPFVLRTLTAAGELTAAETERILLYVGWEPELAAKVARRWSTSTSSTAKESTATDLLTLYDGERATREQTLAALEQLGYPADAALRKVELVEARRVASAKSAAVSDLHTAYKKGEVTRPATVAALERLGLDASSAGGVVDAWQTYLDAAAASTPPTPSPRT